MTNRERIFHLSAKEVSQVLLCDENDTEDALPLDHEDIWFLEEDLQVNLQESTCEEILKVAIEAPKPSLQSSTIPIEVPKSSNMNTIGTTTNSTTDFCWKELTISKQKFLEANYSAQQQRIDSTQFGQILLDVMGSEIVPYQVFRKLANFEEFISEIVKPQTVLYSQQKGHIFSSTLKEMKAFFGMNIVTGYHKLPSIRDYWSSEPDLSVPYIANIMLLKRLKKIRAYLHFNDNNQMVPRDDPLHDRTFKVRPMVDHFNKCFLNGMSPYTQQSIDEHMVKFKGHNILKQCVNGKTSTVGV